MMCVLLSSWSDDYSVCYERWYFYVGNYYSDYILPPPMMLMEWEMLLGKERMHVKIVLLLCRCNDNDVEVVELLLMMILCHRNVYAGYHRDGHNGNISIVNFCACFVVIDAAATQYHLPMAKFAFLSGGDGNKVEGRGWDPSQCGRYR